MKSPRDGEAELANLLLRSPWHVAVMEVVAATAAPDAYIAAGAIRDLVWDERYGDGFRPSRVHDVDVVFYDASDLEPARDAAVDDLLRRLAPEIPWQAKNQAAVHLWYPERFGLEVEPLTSVADAVATFPETATAVAARLDGRDVDIVAPLGLADLLDGTWRTNPRRVSVEEARARVRRKRPDRRWPGVRVLPS